MWNVGGLVDLGPEKAAGADEGHVAHAINRVARSATRRPARDTGRPGGTTRSSATDYPPSSTSATWSGRRTRLTGRAATTRRTTEPTDDTRSTATTGPRYPTHATTAAAAPYLASPGGDVYSDGGSSVEGRSAGKTGVFC
jgi:hypothetical protein